MCEAVNRHPPPGYPCENILWVKHPTCVRIAITRPFHGWPRDMSHSHQIIDLHQVKASCADCNLSELCLPRGLHHEELVLLDSVSQRSRTLHRSDFVFESGDPFKAIYAVRSGIIKLYQDSDHGEERILGFYLPGELLGLDAIHSGRHTCSALAIETSSICSFPYDQLEEACFRIRGLHHQMCQLMSREISAENEHLLMLKNKTAEERIAGFLVNLSSRFQRLGYSGTDFKLPMSREEIGNYLGLTTETVSRLLSKMQRDEIIESSRRFISIKNLAYLQQVLSNHQQKHKGSEQNSVA
ncbi:MAG: fumarate/nitrate reduction transcriptional regulator Fnr [Gammaproteobacteria bacterium]|nr:fumarate/nitrate reduction transcriptional regulator Fnr [Gammaproteobacteria bacterium]